MSGDPVVTGARTGAHALLAALARAGIHRLHGVPGHGAYPLYDAINDVPGIEPIVARHEQGAGFAAVGEAWATGGLAAMTCVPRAGLANAATALMEATASQDRVLAILEDETGQHALAGEVARYHVRASADKPLGPVVDELVHHLANGRPGAAVLEVAAAALAAQQPPRAPHASALRLDGAERSLDSEAERLLGVARRPLILAGASALACVGDADPGQNPVARLAEALGAPIVADGFAPGLLPETHLLSVPPGWSPGGPAAELATRADLVVAIGAPLAAAQNTVRWDPVMLAHTDSDRTLLVDWDDTEQRAVSGRRLHGPVPAILEAMGVASPGRGGMPAPGWSAELLAQARAAASEWVRVLPGESRRWLGALVTGLGVDGIVVADSLVGVWLHRLLAPPAPRRLRFPWGTGTLGAALPAAIGAKLARPDVDVTAIAGDGAFLYSAGELATLRQLELPLTVVVANDDAYGAVRDNLGAAYGRSTVHDLVNPDFVALAEAFGLASQRCDHPEELPGALAAARRRDRASLIEIPLVLHPPRQVFA